MAEIHPQLKSLKRQQTFCMIKPDGVARGLIGDIIYRIEKSGLKIVALKMLRPERKQLKKHYPLEDAAWINRLGVKSVSSFDNLDISPKEALGSEDTAKIGKEVGETLVDYLASGPVVCMVVEGIQAIEMVRKIAGHTLPFKAAVGTIRGDYSVDSPSIANAEHRSIHNLFHASENLAEAANEIKLWFGDEPTHNYRLAGESVMYEKHY